MRAAELLTLSEAVTIVVVWGRWRFDLAELPDTEPRFAIERPCGRVEFPPE